MLGRDGDVIHETEQCWRLLLYTLSLPFHLDAAPSHDLELVIMARSVTT